MDVSHSPRRRPIRTNTGVQGSEQSGGPASSESEPLDRRLPPERSAAPLAMLRSEDGLNHNPPNPNSPSKSTVAPLALAQGQGAEFHRAHGSVHFKERRGRASVRSLAKPFKHYRQHRGVDAG